MQFYVYEWFRNDNLSVFHVGKGKGERRFDTYTRNSYFKNIVNKHDCSVRIYKYCNSEEEAWEVEQERIAELKAIGQAQTNFHVGGIGGDTWSHRSKEEQERWRQNHRKIMLKIYQDENERLRRGRKGRVITKEQREKISIARQGIKLSKEQIEKIRLSQIGRQHKEETKKKMSDSRKIFLQKNPHEMERVRKQVAEMAKSEEGKKRSKNIAKQNWYDTSIREKMVDGIKKSWTEEKRELYSSRQKEKWKDEEYREKIVTKLKKNKDKVKRGVVKYDGVNFEVFESFDEPVEKYGVNKPNLVNCCRGKLKKTKGFNWFYSYCNLDEKGKYPNTSLEEEE